MKIRKAILFFKAFGRKDLGKLVRKVIVNKNGHKQTVYVKMFDEKPEDKFKTGEKIESIEGIDIARGTNAILLTGKTYPARELMNKIREKLGIGRWVAEKRAWAFPIEHAGVVLGELEAYFDPELAKGTVLEGEEKAKTVAAADAADVADLRQGYINEKPAEILNVGKDVVGAVRHHFDTYDNVVVDLKVMENDGSASVFVTKNKLLGKTGLANEAERLAAGESARKILASFAIRKYLSQEPADNPEARQKYYEFCRTITRMDNETKNPQDFISGLAKSYETIFMAGMEKGPNGRYSMVQFSTAFHESKKVVGEVLALIMMREATGIPYFMRGKKFDDAIRVMEVLNAPLEPFGSRLNEVKERLIGKDVLAGVKIKKGDQIDMSKLKAAGNGIARRIADYKDPDDARKAQILAEKMFKCRKATHGLLAQKKYVDSEGYSAVPLSKEDMQSVLGMREGHPPFANIEEAAAYASEQIPILKDQIDKLRNWKQIEAVGNGQVIKVYRNGDAEVLVTFADGLKRSVKMEPKSLVGTVVSKQQEAKTQSKPTYDLYVEKNVIRKGGKAYGEMKPAELQRTLVNDFGVAGLQYGNSMNDNERASHTRWTAEAFSDLSDILKVPAKTITGNGKLSLGFGARGKGTRNKPPAAAHYESAGRVINLTRASGFGSLAHEVGHFYDNIMSGQKSEFLSDHAAREPKQVSTIGELQPGDIIETDKKSYFYDPSHSYPFVELRKGETKPGEFPKRVWFRSDRVLQDATVTRVMPVTPTKSIAMEIAKVGVDAFANQRDEAIASAERDGLEMETAYLKASYGLPGTVDKYFSAPHEAFARAFEVYVAEKLAEQKRENTYLASMRKTTNDHGKIVYVQGEARKKIVELFDKFFEAVRKDNLLEKAWRSVKSQELRKGTAIDSIKAELLK